MPNVTSWIEYDTQDGDTLDQIALEMYEDEHMADAILDLNPEYSGTIVFGAGERLRIPVYDDEEEEDAESILPPWRTSE